MPYREMMIIIGILTGLIVLNKINLYFPQVVREKIYHIIVGLSILLSFNVINIILAIIEIKSASVLSEIFLINLIYLAGSLFGALLMVNGFSEWIPAIQKYKTIEHNHTKRLELFKKAEHYLNDKDNFNEIAENILTDVVTLYDYNHVKLIACNTKSGLLHTITQAGTKQEYFKFESVEIDNTLYNLFGECHLKFKGIINQPEIILPLIYEHKPAAFLCLWKDNDKPDAEDDIKEISSIKILLENILQSKVRCEFEQVFRSGVLSPDFLTNHHTGRTIEEKIQTIYNQIKSLIPLDYMSLIVKRVNENFHKYSVSYSGYVLKEVNTDFFTAPGVSTYCYKNNIPVIIDDLGKETDFIVETLVMKNNMRSMAVFPLDDNKAILGIITFASKKASAYKGKTRFVIESNLSSLRNIIFDQQYHNDISKQLNRLKIIEKYALNANGNYEPQYMIKRAIDLLAEEIHPSMIRYSELSQEDSFLYSHTLRTIIPYDKIMPNDGIMIKSLMPNHQVVIEHKKTLHLSNNSNIPESEAVQIFGRNVSSMVIVPVIHTGKLYGLISMAELRNQDRYDFKFSDIKLTESIARVLSQGLSRYEQVESMKANSDNISRIKNDSKLSYSLSGIANSVEILKQNENRDSQTVKACISILDSSMKDINKSLTRYLDVN